MKSLLKLTLLSFLFCFIGYTMSSMASPQSPKPAFNFAVVDVQQIVFKYNKINVLNTNRRNKFLELNKFVDDAKIAIAQEKNAQKRKSLEDKYGKELQTKKAAIDEDYKKKLSVIDKNISDVIGSTAKSNGYDAVFVKNSVLYGGKDITASVLKSLSAVK